MTYYKKISSNPKARYDNHIIDTYEAGLVLTGAEVKAMKAGRVSVKGAFVKFIKGEPYAVGVKVTESSFHSKVEDKDRLKKLLLKKREMDTLRDFANNRGSTVVVLSAYDKRGLLKISIGSAKGKKNYDKREALKEREMVKERDRYIKNIRGV